MDSTTLSFQIDAISSGTLQKYNTTTKLWDDVSAGTTLAAGEKLQWQGEQDANGELDAFTVRAYDGELASDKAIQVTINTAAINDAPILNTINGAIADAANSAALGSTSNLSGALIGDDAESGTNLTYGLTGGINSIHSVDGAVFNISQLGSYGTLHLNSSTGAYKYVPDVSKVDALEADETPAENFSFTASDGVETTTQSYVINLTGATDAASTSHIIKAIDGYVSGADVYIDANNDGVINTGDISLGKTDQFGNIVINDQYSDNNVIFAHGTDSFTHQTISGQLVSLASSGVATPLTTLLALSKGSNLTEADLKSALGIPASVDLSIFDPIQAMSQTEVPGLAAIAEKLFIVQQTVFTVMQTASSVVLANGTALTDPAAALKIASTAVANAISQVVSQSNIGEFNLAIRLDSITQSAVTAVIKITHPDISPALAASQALGISAVIQATNVELISNYSGLAKALQTNDSTVLLQAAATASVSQTSVLTIAKTIASAITITEVQAASSTFIDNLDSDIATKAQQQNIANAKTLIIDPKLVQTDLSKIQIAQVGAIAIGGLGVSRDSELTIQLGEEGLSTAIENGLPSFGVDLNHNGVLEVSEIGLGHVTLEGTLADIEGLSSVDAHALANAGIDEIRVDLNGGNASTTYNINNLVSGSGVSSPTLNALHSDAQTLAAQGIDLSLEVGQQPLTISDAQANTLVSAGLSFAMGDDITVDGAYGTHLSTSLKDLEKLKIDQVSVGADGLNVDLGAGGLDGLGSGADGIFGTSDDGIGVQFGTGGIASLNLTDANTKPGDLTAIDGFTDEFTALANAGFDQVSIEQITNIDSLLGGASGLLSSTDSNVGLGGSALGNLANATNGTGLTLSISDAQAHALVNSGLEFADGNNIALDGAYGTHLSTSLKDLEKLKIDQVSVGADGLQIDVGGTFTVDALGQATGLDAIEDNRIQFTGGQVRYGLEIAADDQYSLANLAKPGSLIDELVGMNVNRLTIHESLDLSGDWIPLGQIDDIFDASGNQITTHLALSGAAAAPIDFNLALHNQLSGDLRAKGADQVFIDKAISEGWDLLGNFTEPNHYGDLINALAGSGVTDFVVESGEVQITDDLAGALVSAGMLQALPSANLAIDATGQLEGSTSKYAYLSTTLKGMAEINANSVLVDSGADGIYLNLGISTDSQDVLADLKAILEAIDPANGAKLIHADNSSGDPQSVSLVMSADLANAFKDLGGLDEKTLSDLYTKIGITEIDILSSGAVPLADISTNPDVAKSGLANQKVAQDTPNLPEVKIIGAGQLHDDLLDHHAPTVLPPK